VKICPNLEYIVYMGIHNLRKWEHHITLIEDLDLNMGAL
jgi:hypothetical protein